MDTTREMAASIIRLIRAQEHAAAQQWLDR